MNIKRVAIFVGLKVAELAGIVAFSAVLWGIGWVAWQIFPSIIHPGSHLLMPALVGGVVVLSTILTLLVGTVWISENWKTAGKLAKKKRAK